MKKHKRPSKEEVQEFCIRTTGGLEQSSLFNSDLRFAPGPIADDLQKIVDHFAQEIKLPTGPKRRAEALRNLETLLSNLITTRAKDQRRYVSFSQSPNSYGKNGRFSPITSGLIAIVKELEQQGYLFKYDGFQRNTRGRLARLKGREKFYQLLETQLTTEPTIHARPNDLIQLRKKQGKEKVIVPRHVWKRQNSPELNRDIDALEKLCESFNDIISHHEINYIDVDGRERMLCPYLYRVFTENFHCGGRYYCGYGGHQNLSKESRSTITIDNEPTVELDYSGLHLRMIYHKVGRFYPLDVDPYLAVLDASNCPFELAEDGKPLDPEIRLIRDDLKKMLLALINDECSPSQARARAHRRLFTGWVEKKDFEARERLRTECEEREKRWKKLGLTVESVLRGFHKAHRPIKRRFSSGEGLLLQYLDSEMATAVMFCLKMFQIPCLPVHDSYIVPVSKRDILERSMELSYHHVMRSQADGKLEKYRIPIG